MSAHPLARAQPEPERAGDPARPRGQPLPLHRLPEHRRGREVRGAGRADMATAERTSGSAPHSSARRTPPYHRPGPFVDDIKLPGTLAAAFARSPHAPRPHRLDRHLRGGGHARRGRRATPPPRSASRAACPCASNPTGDAVQPKRPLLAEGVVRMLGEPVAVVAGRDGRPGARRGRPDRRRLRPAARRRARRGRGQAGRPAAPRRRTGQHLLRPQARDGRRRRGLRERRGDASR